MITWPAASWHICTVLQFYTKQNHPFALYPVCPHWYDLACNMEDWRASTTTGSGLPHSNCLKRGSTESQSPALLPSCTVASVQLASHESLPYMRCQTCQCGYWVLKYNSGCTCAKNNKVVWFHYLEQLWIWPNIITLFFKGINDMMMYLHTLYE